MIISTTTNSIEGKEIYSYEGIVFGEVVTPVNIMKEMGLGFASFLGGKGKGYKEQLLKARKEALDEMEARAKAKGADAIVGVKLDYNVLGEYGSALILTCSGTAVKIR